MAGTEFPKGNANLILDLAAAASGAIRFDQLGLSPVALDLGFFTLKWYSLAYLAGILIGYWYLLKLIAQPGSPLARRHADDMIFYATLGIIIGGRLAYVFFYQPEILRHPLDIFKIATTNAAKTVWKSDSKRSVKRSATRLSCAGRSCTTAGTPPSTA